MTSLTTSPSRIRREMPRPKQKQINYAAKQLVIFIRCFILHIRIFFFLFSPSPFCRYPLLDELCLLYFSCEPFAALDTNDKCRHIYHQIHVLLEGKWFVVCTTLRRQKGSNDIEAKLSTRTALSGQRDEVRFVFFNSAYFGVERAPASPQQQRKIVETTNLHRIFPYFS